MEQLYEPTSRLGHVACSSCAGNVIIWGGETSKFFSCSECVKLASVVEEFDPCNEIWRQRNTIGTPHPGLSTAASTSVGDKLYLYGGAEQSGNSFSGALSCLNMELHTWSPICQEAVIGGPMRKIACGMVSFHTDKLAVIGGYGCLSGSKQHESTFSRDTRVTNTVVGWTNEFHICTISQGTWSSPTLKGIRLPPCSFFTLTNIGNHKAIFFGGFQPKLGRVNDLYIIDFDKMEITKLGPCKPWPAERSNHAACCIGSTCTGDNIHLLITGGTGKDGKVLNDAWLFNVWMSQWKEATLPDAISLQRREHTATVTTLYQGLEVLVLCGGSTDEDLVETPKKYSSIAETTIITFGQLDSEWLLVDVTNNNQRGNRNRVSEKIKLKSGNSITDSPFDRDRHVTTYALYRIEREGIQLRRGISYKHRDFQAVLRLKHHDANLAMLKWLNTERKTEITPTWKNFLLILRLIDLDHLAKQVEAYLRRTTVEQLFEDTSSMEQVARGKRFDLDSMLTMASLIKLESDGILVLSQLEKKNHVFQTIIRVKQHCVSNAINKWLSAPVLSCIIPSWKNFLTILCLIELDDLAKKIKGYLLNHEGEECVRKENLILVKKLCDKDETICQLRKENRQLRQRLSAGLVVKEEAVPSPWPSLTKSQLCLPWYHIKEDYRKRSRKRSSDDSLSSPESITEYIGLSPKKKHAGSTVQLHPRTHENTKNCNKPTLKYLMKELDPALASKWEEFGIELNIDHQQLDKIKADNTQNCTKCLRETLKFWLKIKNPPPSWDTIVAAVKELNEELGSRLKSKYCNDQVSSGSQETL